MCVCIYIYIYVMFSYSIVSRIPPDQNGSSMCSTSACRRDDSTRRQRVVRGVNLYLCTVR